MVRTCIAWTLFPNLNKTTQRHMPWAGIYHDLLQLGSGKGHMRTCDHVQSCNYDLQIENYERGNIRWEVSLAFYCLFYCRKFSESMKDVCSEVDSYHSKRTKD
jgi:hypothetical protein